MDTIDSFFNSLVDGIMPYFPDSPKKNPRSFDDFLNYFNEHDNIDELFEKYNLLNHLNTKYGFVRNKDICVRLEFEIIHEFIPNLPNLIVPNEYYNNILTQYEHILERKKERRRFEKTIDFICSIFQSFCTGIQSFDHSYVQIPIALCVGFGRPNINRNLRRLIYDRLNHNDIINSEIETPIQASMLKIYCRFINFCGKPATPEFMDRLNHICYEEKNNTKEENFRDYNKRVRLFNSININVQPKSSKSCIDYVEPHFYIRDGFLCNKKERILYLDEYTNDIQKEVVEYLNLNYTTVVIYIYPYKEQLMIEVNGRIYIKKLWNHKTKKNSIEIY